MSDNNEKLESLSKMMDEMELAGFRKMMETSCQHDWVTDGTGHYYCSKCGADGGSAWDC